MARYLQLILTFEVFIILIKLPMILFILFSILYRLILSFIIFWSPILVFGLLLVFNWNFSILLSFYRLYRLFQSFWQHCQHSLFLIFVTFLMAMAFVIFRFFTIVLMVQPFKKIYLWYQPVFLFSHLQFSLFVRLC